MAEERLCDDAECTSDCSTCSHAKKDDMKKPLNAMSSIKNVIAVVSGKGGVGKSMVTASIASDLAAKGYKVGILDADITGPSIPKMYGITEKAQGNEGGIFPAEAKNGIRIMSINLLLENPEDPVIWRGPVIAGVVTQFWTDVIWGDLDYLLIDMPPGTGDVPLTVFQSIAIDEIIIVTSPQDLVGLIVAKAYKMAKTMNIKVKGIVENYSYFECPECGRKEYIFGESKIDEIANQMDIPVLAKIPLKPEYASLADSGLFDKVVNEYVNDIM